MSLESRKPLFTAILGEECLFTEKAVWLMLWNSKSTNTWDLCEMHSNVAWTQSRVFTIPDRCFKISRSLESQKAQQPGQNAEEFQAYGIWTGRRKAACPSWEGDWLREKGYGYTRKAGSEFQRKSHDLKRTPEHIKHLRTYESSKGRETEKCTQWFIISLLWK